MPPTPRVLLVSGLGRPSAVTREVIRLVRSELDQAKSSCTVCSLKDFNLPLYDGEEDLTALPPKVSELTRLISGHESLLLLAPEFHGGIAPLVKNAFDWAATAQRLAGAPTLLSGKSTALVTVSPHTHVGVQALTQMSALFHHLGGTVMPGSLGVWDHASMLNEAQQLIDKGSNQRLAGLVRELLSASAHSGK